MAETREKFDAEFKERAGPAGPIDPPLFRSSVILRALTWKTLQQPSSRASTLLTGCSPCL